MVNLLPLSYPFLSIYAYFKGFYRGLYLFTGSDLPAIFYFFLIGCLITVFNLSSATFLASDKYIS